MSSVPSVTSDVRSSIPSLKNIQAYAVPASPSLTRVSRTFVRVEKLLLLFPNTVARARLTRRCSVWTEWDGAPIDCLAASEQSDTSFEFQFSVLCLSTMFVHFIMPRRVRLAYALQASLRQRPNTMISTTDALANCSAFIPVT